MVETEVCRAVPQVALANGHLLRYSGIRFNPESNFSHPFLLFPQTASISISLAEVRVKVLIRTGFLGKSVNFREKMHRAHILVYLSVETQIFLCPKPNNKSKKYWLN